MTLRPLPRFATTTNRPHEHAGRARLILCKCKKYNRIYRESSTSFIIAKQSCLRSELVKLQQLLLRSPRVVQPRISSIITHHNILSNELLDSIQARQFQTMSSSTSKSCSSSIFLPPSQTRLVTIAAHVDHGKTTLADQLIEYNGLISERLAGSLRYLDSDPEEQRRGITIRASAIGLRHQVTTMTPENASVQQQQQQSTLTLNPQLRIIHLVDSPGHADFSREVSTSLLACDGTLLVLDVVEGMGARTHQLLREAREHQLVPVLVVNKMDRLCCELSLTPMEAYLRVRELLETVNAAAAGMLNSALHVTETTNGDDDDETEELNQGLASAPSPTSATVSEEDARLWTFDPASGNVIFASAFHGWAFAIPSLARSLFRSKAIHIKPVLLRQYLFGDYKLREQDKIVKWKQGGGGEDGTLFAEFALQPIWDVYQNVAVAAATLASSSNRWTADTFGMDQVLQALQIGATGTECPATREQLVTLLQQTGAQSEEAVVRALLRRFRPLARTVLDVVSEYLPSPATAASSIRSRALALKLPDNGDASEELKRIQQAVAACDASANAPSVAHVCKFMAADRSNIRDPNLETSDGSNSVILGMARVLSGRLTTGSAYHLLGPKHTTDSPPPPKRTIRCYLLMGSSFVLVDEVPAGHLCAIANLDDVYFKTVTLCDSPHGMPLQGFDNRLRPLVKVNVEAKDAADTNDLERGLAKLGLADASVEVTVSAKGERILACLGELHLEQSLLDLRTIYCGREMDLRVSDPIVDFGETTDWFEHELDFRAFFDSKAPPLRQTLIPPYNEEADLEYAKNGRMRSLLPGRAAAVSIRTIPLVSSVCESIKARRVIEGSEEEFVEIGKAIGLVNPGQEASPEAVLEALAQCTCALTHGDNLLVDTPAVRHGLCVQGVVSSHGEVYDPVHAAKCNGDNNFEAENRAYLELQSKIKDAGFRNGVESQNNESTDLDKAARQVWNEELKGSLYAGFQNALRSGPICEEPVRNVLVIVEGVEFAVQKKDDGSWTTAKPISGGMIVGALGTGIRCSLLTRPARLMEGHLKLTLHASLSALGSLYPVLHKRRGKVLEESMVDGTDLILIEASIPQAEAFGLAPEVFGKTSGEVTAPEMNFSHWERLDVDPFWIPTTEEEREDFGELVSAGDSSTGLDNPALKYIRQVRRRKGLRIDQARTVLAAEKQRTLKR
ncbi:hypothetical protein MPSEU_000340900 [Mayamaea pseudoterrestris]|nr:hypothetical protein MPSEU_000340900 [Mayamaea pseudoterrestris]